jgi:twitching motility protein PilT
MTFEISRVKRVEERTRVGTLAVEHGLLSQRELDALLERARVAGPHRVRLGELMVRERYVTAPMLRELLNEQRRQREQRAAPAPAAVAVATARVEDLLRRLSEARGQELLLMTNHPPAMRLPDTLRQLAEPALDAAQLDAFAAEVFDAAARERAARGEPLVRIVAYAGLGRFRVRLGTSEQGTSLSFRPVGMDPRSDGIELPRALERLAGLRRGLVVIAGPSAPYRTSVLAKLVDQINENSRRHVISIERCPTYEHRSKLSLVAQREVGVHTASYEAALRATLREDPDVLAIGEIEGAEAIATALLSAETGHLVLCSLHATSTSQALRRLIDVQGTAQRALVRATLASTLQAVVVLDVVAGGGKDRARHVVVDVMPGTPAVARMIREDRLHQLDAAAKTQPGAVCRDAQLRALCETGEVTRLNALQCASDPAAFEGLGARVTGGE